VLAPGHQEGESPRHLEIRHPGLRRLLLLLVTDVSRQEPAEEPQEGARRLLGLGCEIGAAAHIGERAQDHLAQFARELVRRSLPAPAGLQSLGHVFIPWVSCIPWR
jgi:hypothetical protein